MAWRNGSATAQHPQQPSLVPAIGELSNQELPMIGPSGSQITLAAAALACMAAVTMASPSLAASHPHHRGAMMSTGARHSHADPAARGFVRTPAQEDPDPGYQTWSPNSCWEDDGYGRRTSCDAN
jgi:hypothetical protein